MSLNLWEVEKLLQNYRLNITYVEDTAVGGSPRVTWRVWFDAKPATVGKPTKES